MLSFVHYESERTGQEHKSQTLVKNSSLLFGLLDIKLLVKNSKSVSKHAYER
jgi:hypothetical protein